MKIMFVMLLSSWDCSRNTGGTDSVCQLLLKGAINDKNNQYLVIGFNPFNDTKGDVTKIDLASNISLHLYNSIQNKRSIFHRIIPNLFYQNWIVKSEVLDFQPDIIHVHVPCWLLFKYNKVKRILTLHTYKNICRKDFGFLNHMLYIWFATPITIKHSTLITTVSRDIEFLLQKERIPAVYIPNPILDDFFRVERKIVNKQIIVLPSNVVPRKRIQDALKVIERVRAEFPQIKLYIAGIYKKDSYYKELTTFIEQHNLQENIIFLGQISVHELCELYSKAQVGLFLSEEETFGLAPLEMIAARLPIVTTKVGVLKHEENFASLDIDMVGIGDIKETSATLSRILMTKSEGSLPAVDFIRRKYSLASITSQYLEVYQ